jgi:hypothetical protein
MLILDEPYISDFLENTIVEMELPVLKNDAIEKFDLSDNINYISDEEFIKKFKENEEIFIYSNSENPINWISNNLSFSNLPKKINIFKNKVKFRKLLKDIYPDFFYKEISFSELDEVDITEIKKPFIIKPSIGFFSMGVHKVNSVDEWGSVVSELKREVKRMQGKYPIEVINANKFIIEENIEGEEFAIDVYYNNSGEAVILNIFKHIFSSDEDVSDRVYITSKEIIEKYHSLFSDFLSKMGDLVNLCNFPMHVEFRVDKDNQVIPIEVNPMRFAGWCTTDIAYYAYGINVYEYFFKQKTPDWEEILKDKEDKIYSIVVADLPGDIEIDDVEGIDYEGFISHFENPLEVRKIDYEEHAVFAFLFTETNRENWQELEEILNSDLKEYIKLKE